MGGKCGGKMPLTIMSLVCPPEGIVSQSVVRLESNSHSPSLVVGKSMSILLEERVDSRDTSIPTVFQIFKR